MEMTNEEICRNYQQAKNRQYQIKILADMNLVSTDEIRKILIDGGALKPKTKKSDAAAVPEKSEPLKSFPESSADWKDAMKIIMERITELKAIRDNAEKELDEIRQTLGSFSEKN